MLVGSLVMSLWGGTERRAEGMVGFVTLAGAAILVMGLGETAVLPFTPFRFKFNPNMICFSILASQHFRNSS